ncbi:uncharacterized protein LOC132397072 [Hypanus sabinus]|uniref:uncharacterized protein LOC132397072 n=1 Tax=Hypanus sabinus TaxID=79690 RepID=UPI0028C42631|nr:uncharacterized protein LOC132397072 [Hypanus sabinus]
MFNPLAWATAPLPILILFISVFNLPQAAAMVKPMPFEEEYITKTVAAPLVKPMPFEEEYITEIAEIDYPEERIEAYTNGGMVEYIREKRAEPSPSPPSPSPKLWPVEEIITTTIFPGIEEDDVIEVIRNKRKAAKPAAKYMPLREPINTTRRPFKAYMQAKRNRRAEPNPSSRLYLKEYITAKPYQTGKHITEEDIVTTVTYPVVNESGFVIRQKHAAEAGFFHQCLAKLLGVALGVAVIAALIYYYWYRKLRRAKEQADEGSVHKDRKPYHKKQSSYRNLRDSDQGDNYAYQSSPGSGVW